MTDKIKIFFDWQNWFYLFEDSRQLSTYVLKMWKKTILFLELRLASPLKCVETKPDNPAVDRCNRFFTVHKYVEFHNLEEV